MRGNDANKVVWGLNNAGVVHAKYNWGMRQQGLDMKKTKAAKIKLVPFRLGD